MININEFYKKHIHFIGIGGISMSSLAKYLLNKGCIITGSDICKNEETLKLKNNGIKIFFQHKYENIVGADLVVYNSAIKNDNIELLLAKEKNIPVISRIDLLNAISQEFRIKVGIAGSHGKTTATALISNILKNQNFNFFAHIGGEDIELGNHYYSGNDIFISEICEYNRNINKFTADIGCLLNIGFDHVDSYSSFNDISKTFVDFIDRSTFKIYNTDDEKINYKKESNCLTYGFRNNSDITASNIRFIDNMPNFDLYEFGKFIDNLSISIYGKHNIYNCLCSYAVCKKIGLNNDEIINGIKKFKGVKKRFEQIGFLNGCEVICDYAHHPKEISAALDTIHKIKKGKKILVVFQPHTYSRTRVLLNEFVESFKNVDNLILFKTYPAREKYDYEGSSEKLYNSLICSNKKYFDDSIEMFEYINKKTHPNDVIIVLGAGDIYNIFKNKVN